MTTKKIIVSVILGVIITALSAVAMLLYVKSNNLMAQLAQSRQTLQKIQEAFKTLQEDKAKLSKENEKLQTDAVSYVSLQTELQQEKDNLQKRLDEVQAVIDAKEEELKKLNQKLEHVENTMTREQLEERKSMLKEKQELENKLKLLNITLGKERALYHYKLGVAYTQAKLYDEAVDAYEKSLKFNPDNPDAHYNVALLYDNFKADPVRAAIHFQRYLELKPDASDKVEVEAWISKAKGALDLE
jgi:tetratricopeptide (TPR) repeat protein